LRLEWFYDLERFLFSVSPAFTETDSDNIIAFRPKVETPLVWRQLADNILHHRHEPESAKWLTEIVYLLMAARRCNVTLHWDLIQKFAELYEQLTDILQFRTEEYPRLLHIALELERQGMPGQVAARMINWIRSRELVGAEQSDDRRLYVSWLFWQRNTSALGHAEAQALGGRLMRRLARADVFAQLPMGADLARGITILTAMGDVQPPSMAVIEKSVENGLFYGVLADDPITVGRLISVCHLLGMTVPQPIENYLFRQVSRLRFDGALPQEADDDLILLFAAQPAAYEAGLGVMQLELPTGPFSAHLPLPNVSPLREVTDVLRGMSQSRTGDWHSMRAQIESQLSFPAFNRLHTAATCSGFDAFFEVFARPYERL
jgi:hypothetical protein